MADNWAALWKRAAKKQKRDADRILVVWIKAVLRLGWSRRWARIWKGAAKRHRRFNGILQHALLTARIKYRDAWYWSRAWKASAKKWRRSEKQWFNACGLLIERIEELEELLKEAQ